MSPPSRNIELKARLHDLAAARQTAKRLATGHLGIQRQIDTYFKCASGRLKLREIEGQPPALIGYRRPDEQSARASDYQIVEVADVEMARAILSTALGVLVVIAKRREVFLHHNVRIHLDEVERLGTFLEFEAVLGDIINDETARQQVAWLREQFAVADADLLASSYSDMLLATRNASAARRV